MTIPTKDYLSYFGLFTFNYEEDSDLVWTGSIKKTRIEVCPIGNQSSNRMGVMYLYGRDEMHPNDTALCEITPLSQDLMRDVKVGDVLTVKHGSILFGEFKVLYFGESTF